MPGSFESQAAVGAGDNDCLVAILLGWVAGGNKKLGLPKGSRVHVLRSKEGTEDEL